MSSISEELCHQLPMPAGRSFGLDAVRISRDGHRVYASIESMQWACFKDLKSGETLNLRPQRPNQMNLDVPPPFPIWNLYRVVESIAALPDGVAICGRRN